MRSKLLIIGLQWPEPNATAAGMRMMQLIRCFQRAGYDIWFASTASTTAYSEDLAKHGVSEKNVALNDSAFDTWLRQLKPDMVLFDRFIAEEQFGWRVAENCPLALRILDTQDLHSLRVSREICLKAGDLFKTEHWLTSEVTLRELASIFRSDITLIISPFEMALLRKAIPAAEPLLWKLPFMEDTVTAKQLPPFELRSDFLFIGNGRHHPNVDAILWLNEKIWPGIRRILPGAVMAVYGAYLPDTVTALHDPASGFLIRGWIPNTREALKKARIQLVPLRFGAGLKGKLIDSLASGCPFITTPIGAEGMLAGAEWEGSIAAGADEIIARAVALYQVRENWNNAQKLGMALLNSQYNREQHENAFLGRVDAVGSQLIEFRKQNLIGAMMLHHRMASTTYLSKWIEAKNSMNGPMKS